ncbi:hypothetical protein [Halorhabdus utahensis]|nr:hypothetical protein [Halorhabdus utahensis]
MADIEQNKDDVVADLDARLNEWLDSFEHADPDGEIIMSENTKARLEDLSYLQDYRHSVTPTRSVPPTNESNLARSINNPFAAGVVRPKSNVPNPERPPRLGR